MGTPGFAVPALEKLVEEGFDIPLVVTQQDKRKGRGKKLQATEVKARALELGLEVYQPESVNSEESLEKIKSINPDIIVVTAYGQILKEELLKLPKFGCINIHGSILPKYRGAAPINRAIMEGESETGITIMEMEKGLDTGDMLRKEAIEIGKEDDFETIHDKLSILGGNIIGDVLRSIEKGIVERVVQDDKKATYAEKIFKDTGIIDWNMEGRALENFIRGLRPWPTAYTKYQGKILKINRVEIIDRIEEGELGEVLEVSNNGVKVKGSNCTILIKEFQVPGKRMMKVEDYLRGNTFEEGLILG